jgi:MOSC domain-containing protein YiiM
VTAVAGTVVALSASATHSLAKQNRQRIRVIENHGVDGDAHAGTTVKHRSRVAVDPQQPNLRQVHLLHAELHEALAAAGMPVSAGQMGENITTRGIDLLALATGTRLHVGATAVLEVTGLRNPCKQLDRIHPGLMAATLERGANGRLIRKAGVMAVVRRGGDVVCGDAIVVESPTPPHLPLEPV